MKILVLGGFGFLGGRITQYFTDAGHNVFQGTSSKIKLVNSNVDGAKVVQIDWNNQEKLDFICRDIDLIIHASGMNSRDCIDDPIGALRVNAVSTASILQSAIKMHVKRFIYISTIHVYKDSLVGNISELDSVTNAHPYATSNRAGEDTVMWAQKNKFIDGIVVRVSNGFGAPKSKNANCWMLLVNDLCSQAVKNKKLVLNSNGLEIRNFIPISEICNAIDFLVCQIPFELRIGNDGPINIGSKTSISVLDMAKLIQSRCGPILGYTPELLVKEKKNSDKISYLNFKTNRLEALGYTYKHTLVNELDKLLIYCANNFK